MQITKISPSSTVVSFTDGTQVLVSYETPVAARIPIGNDRFRHVKSNKFFSRTTNKHVSQWLAGVEAEKITPEEIAALMEDR